MNLDAYSLKISKVNNGYVVHQDLVNRAGYKIHVFESLETLVKFIQEELQKKEQEI